MSRPVSREQLNAAIDVVDARLRTDADPNVTASWTLLRGELRRSRSQSQQMMSAVNPALQSAAIASDLARQSAAASDRVLAELGAATLGEKKDDET